MSGNNREITFIVRMRNEARQAIRGMSGDLRTLAREAGKAAAANKVSAQTIKDVGASAAQAANAVQKMNQHVGGVVNPANRGQKAMKGFWGEIRNAAKEMIRYAAAAALLAGPALLVKSIIDESAAWQTLGARIRVVTDTAEEAAAVQEDLLKRANRSYAPIDALGQVYSRTAGSLKNFGYSQKQILDLTELTAKAMAITTSNAQEATGALIQFGQGISSNNFGGEELRSVLEQGQFLAKALVDGLNKVEPEFAKKYGLMIQKGSEKSRELAIGSLKKLAQDGKLQTEVVARALLSQQEEIDKAFAHMPQTFGRSLNILRNNWMKEATDLDRVFGLNSGLGKAIATFSSDVLPRLSDVLQPVAAAMDLIGRTISGPFVLGSKVFAALGVDAGKLGDALTTIVKLVVSATIAFGALAAVGPLMALLTTGIGAVNGALATMTALIMANPLGLLGVAIAGLITLFLTFKDTTFKVGDDVVSIAGIIAEAWERGVSVIKSILDDVVLAAQMAAVWIMEKWDEMASFLSEVWKNVSQVAGAAFSSIAKFADQYLSPVFRFLAQIPEWYVRVLKVVFDKLGNFFRAGLQTLANAVQPFNQSWADALNAAGVKADETLDGFVDKSIDTLKGMPKLMLDGAVDALMTDPKVQAAVYLGRKIGGAFKGGFLKGAAEHTARQQADQAGPAGGGVNLAQGNGNKVINDPVVDKKAQAAAEKAERERKRRIKQGVDDIQDLAKAYSPYLNAVVRDAELEEKVGRLKALRQTSEKEFQEALGKTNLTLAQYNDLLEASKYNLDAKSVEGFFKAYSRGYEEVIDGEVQRLKYGQIVADLEKAKAAGSIAYANALKIVGLTAEQAEVAIKNFHNGVSNDALERATQRINALTSAYAPYLDKKAQDVQRQSELEKLMAESNTPAFAEALAKAGISTEEWSRAVEQANYALKETPTLAEDARAAMFEYEQNAKASGLTMKDTFVNAFSGAEDALANFIATGKLSFKSMVNGMIADIARLISKILLLKAIEAIGNSILPGAGTAASTALNAGVGHSGGVVGQASRAARSVDATVFAGAKRFHVGGVVGSSSGLKANEVPVIAKKNEAILPTVRMPDGNFGVKAVLPEGSGGGGMMAAGGKVINFAPVINLTIEGGGADSTPEQHGEIVSKALLNSLKGMVRDVLMDEARPGGFLNQ